MFDEHDVIIPRGNTAYISNVTDTSPHSIITTYAPPTCQASENGVVCWRHAEIPHQLGEWEGHWVGGETVWLCQQCYELMWDYVFQIRKTRVRTRQQEQELSA